MAKKKKRRKGRMPKALAKYWAKKRGGKKHHRKEKHVAKRKRRRGSSRRKSSTRRRGGGGGRISKWLPPTDRLMDAAGAGVYGFLETKAKADPANMLNKIPRPIAQLGYTGGTALFLHAANVLFLKSKYVSHLVNGVTNVAAYQMGRAGAMPADATTIFSVAGDDDISGYGDDELSGDEMDALAGEGVGDDDIGDDDDISGLHVDMNPDTSLAGDDD